MADVVGARGKAGVGGVIGPGSDDAKQEAAHVAVVRWTTEGGRECGRRLRSRRNLVQVIQRSLVSGSAW